jgi:hypothetical protein
MVAVGYIFGLDVIRLPTLMFVGMKVYALGKPVLSFSLHPVDKLRVSLAPNHAHIQIHDLTFSPPIERYITDHVYVDGGIPVKGDCVPTSVRRSSSSQEGAGFTYPPLGRLVPPLKHGSPTPLRGAEPQRGTSVRLEFRMIC